MASHESNSVARFAGKGVSQLGYIIGMGNPHGSHDRYRVGMDMGMVLLTHTYTHTCGMGLHTVTVSYLNGCTFLICVLHCLFFPLGLASYMEDQYTFMLGPCSFSLAPIPEGEPTPVPVILFAS